MSTVLTVPEGQQAHDILSIISGLESPNEADYRTYPRECIKIAREFLESYKGTFAPMLDMKSRVAAWGMTPRQALFVLRTRKQDHDFRNQREDRSARFVLPSVQVETTANTATPAPAARKIPNGTFSIVDESGAYVTVKVTDHWIAEESDKQVAKFLSGSNNEIDFTGFAFIKSTGLSVWKRFKDERGQPSTTIAKYVRALQVLANGGEKTWADGSKQYALESGSCSRCGRTLTVPASLHNGMGPVCAGRGWFESGKED